MKVWPSKDPDETLKFSYDFAPDLATGVTLDPAGTTFDAIAGKDAGTVIADRQTDAAGVFTAVIASGNDGDEALYTLRVTASDGQIFEDTIALPIARSDALIPVFHAGDYTDPTPANLVAVFPEFSSVPASNIAYYLRRAARGVDTSWGQGDFGHARILLAAHLMTLGGLGSTAEAQAVKDGSGQFKSMAIGSLRLDRFDLAKDASTFGLTRYGREFKQLLRANKGGPRVTGGTPTPGWGDGDKAWYNY